MTTQETRATCITEIDQEVPGFIGDTEALVQKITRVVRCGAFFEGPDCMEKARMHIRTVHAGKGLISVRGYWDADLEIDID